jgi:hypothetical protein
MKRSVKTTLLWLLILAALPWPVDYLLTLGAERKDRRNEELFRRHECGYYSACAADFDRDGGGARFEFEACRSVVGHCLVIGEGGREVLRLPFHNTDNTLRTHLALREAEGATRLLVYDGAGRRDPLRAVFAWGDGKLVERAPDSLDLEIMDAMAAYDDTGGLNERVFRDIARAARFVVHYLLLVVLAGILLWGKVSLPPGPPPHDRAAHWLLRGDR